MKLLAALCGLCALLLASAAWAMPNALVSGVKMPAWLERGVQRFPLAPGVELYSGDALVTGSDARLLLTTADGSTIKLGENARMQLSGMAQYRHDEPMFSALLDVVKGAFRFTTSALAKLRKREVSIKVAAVTVGIRGTDVWGKVGGSMKIADLEKAMMGKAMPGHDKQTRMAFDVVCLVEGQVSMEHVAQGGMMMAQPMTLLMMPAGEAPMAVSEVAQEQLDKWLLETEIVAGQGAARSGGRWKVNLLEVEDKPAALAAYDGLRTAGYAVRIQSLATGRFRLRLTQLPTRAEAEALAHALTGKLGIQSPTVSR